MTGHTCGHPFGGLCLLHHGGHKCCRSDGHTDPCKCACGAIRDSSEEEAREFRRVERIVAEAGDDAQLW